MRAAAPSHRRRGHGASSGRGAPIIDKIVVVLALIVGLGLFATCAANPRFKCEAMGGDWIPAHQETGSIFGMSPFTYRVAADCQY
jgi:hypothetical protein